MSINQNRPLDRFIITKARFPIGKPVVIEGIIDGSCGWEFDAPMHIMRPFHRYHIVGSICAVTIESKIENLLIDTDIEREICTDGDSWPYDPGYLRRLFLRARRGQARGGVWYFMATVVVKGWSDDDGRKCVDFDCNVELFHQGKKME